MFDWLITFSFILMIGWSIFATIAITFGLPIAIVLFIAKRR